MKVGFAGLSHLGIVSGISVASKGFDVVGYDANTDLVKNLSESRLPIWEPDLDDLLRTSRERITFTAALKDLSLCDVVYVSLDVKTNDENTSDLGPLTDLIGQVANNMTTGKTLVVLSQVPPGFTRKLGVKNVQVYYQVETLIFGRAVERALKPERYIIGCFDPVASLPESYSQLLKAFDCPILPMKIESAELCKISINMFLAASVTTTNTLAELCENIGADWTEIAPALKLDKRIGPYAYLGPGLGLAGGNIERDIATVKRFSMEYGTHGSLAETFLSNSSYRKNWVLRQIHGLEPLAVWGIAYKQDTKSIKNSPAVELAQNLKTLRLQMYDPQASLPETFSKSQVRQVSSPLEACANAEGLAIMTPWSEFKNVKLEDVRRVMKGDLIVDPFAVLDQKTCEKLGFRYLKLGWGQ